MTATPLAALSPRLLLLAIGLICFPCVTHATRTEQSESESAADIVLANERVKIVIDKASGCLRQLSDSREGRNVVGDSQERLGLWQLEFRIDGRQLVLEPHQATTCTWHRDSADRYWIAWEDFAPPEAEGCRVLVTVELPANSAATRWGIAVVRPASSVLERTRFPRLCGLRRAAQELLAVPQWMGQLLAAPRAILCPEDRDPVRMIWSYPGVLSMQCLAFYDQQGQGLFMACEDSQQRRKNFAVWGNRDGDLHLEMEPELTAGGTDTYMLPYQVVLEPCRGDWFTAAQRYREWATQQPWAQQCRLTRDLVPPWVLDTHLWVWNRGRSSGVLEPAAMLQEKLGLPVSVFWHWWHGCPYDIGFPEYFPPREGTESFQQAMTAAHSRGLHTMVYMNQRAWGLSTDSWQQQGAERYAVKDRQGNIHREIYNIFTRQALVPMCLGTSFWRDTYAGLAERAVRELGVDGIYMDQACSHLPCYDPHHDHPPGGGDSWLLGFHSLTEDIRRRCEPETRVTLAGEGCGEAWLPYLDLMLALQVSRERYAAQNDPWEPIPFFQAVYHPYAVTYGSYSSLAEPPYDELWPAEFAPAEPLQLLDRKHSPQFYLEQARTFVWGQQLCIANFQPAQWEQRREEVEYVLRLARLRAQAKKYLLHGEMLQAPAWNPPTTTSEFSRLSIYAGQKDRVTTYPREHPLAIAGAWRASDGDVAMALASVSAEPMAVTMNLDLSTYGLPKRPQVVLRDSTGNRPLGAAEFADSTLRVTLPPLGACLIEFAQTRADGD